MYVYTIYYYKYIYIYTSVPIDQLTHKFGHFQYNIHDIYTHIEYHIVLYNNMLNIVKQFIPFGKQT